MAKTLYCWRCKIDIPMLEEHEWKQVEPYLVTGIEQIKQYREKYHASLGEAKATGYGKEALKIYNELAALTRPIQTHCGTHRLSEFGAPCSSCGKPLRTPTAKHCAECGALSFNLSLHTEPQVGQ